jgi:hypothetical protein
MLDQDHIQKTIKAYVLASVMTNSTALSPNAEQYFRHVSKTLEAETASIRGPEASPSKKAA